MNAFVVLRTTIGALNGVTPSTFNLEKLFLTEVEKLIKVLKKYL